MEPLKDILDRTTDIRDSIHGAELEELYDFEDTPSFQNAFNESVSGQVYTGARLTEEIPKFGESGADGDLTVSTGTTTISAASAKVLIKEYNRILITGGTVDFSNPHADGTIVVLKVRHEFRMTAGTLTLLGMGGTGGAGGAGGATGNPGVAGSAGTAGTSAMVKNGAGSGGTGGLTDDTQGTGGAGGTLNSIDLIIAGKSIKVSCGGGGGGGGGGKGAGGDIGGAGGAGSRGGGAIIVECFGTLLFTGGTITAVGTAGVAGGAASGLSAGRGAGGGGGGGGDIAIIYGLLGANAGTLTVSGAAGGARGGSGQDGGSGGGGGGGAGSAVSGTVGSNGPTSTGSAGGDGQSLVVQNSEWS